jgi:hypothetical protein
LVEIILTYQVLKNYTLQRVTVGKDLLADLFIIEDCDGYGSTTMLGFG